MRRRIHIQDDNDRQSQAAAPQEGTLDGEATGTNADPAEGGPATGGGGGEAEALKARVAELEQQVEAERGQYLRTLADFQNFRRRSEEQRGEIAQFANREILLGLLPVLDNFERAQAAAEKNQSFEALMGGVALTLRQLQDFLKKNGVEPIEARGKEFDPNLHEAVMRDEESDAPENTVVEELQKGYTMHARVLRPSMVKVARGA